MRWRRQYCRTNSSEVFGVRCKAQKPNLDAFEQSHSNYNGMSWNCSDYAGEGFVFGLGTVLPDKEKANDKISVTTPNQLYKAAKNTKGVTVEKEAGKTVEGSSLEKATGGHVDKAVRKAE